MEYGEVWCGSKKIAVFKDMDWLAAYSDMLFFNDDAELEYIWVKQILEDEDIERVYEIGKGGEWIKTGERKIKTSKTKKKIRLNVYATEEQEKELSKYLEKTDMSFLYIENNLGI